MLFRSQKMGADIEVRGRNAFVRGVEKLHSARVTAGDLRGGAALVIAGLAAQGYSEIDGVDKIDRGYEHLEEDLRALGANIWRVV